MATGASGVVIAHGCRCLIDETSDGCDERLVAEHVRNRHLDPPLVVGDGVFQTFEHPEHVFHDAASALVDDPPYVGGVHAPHDPVEDHDAIAVGLGIGAPQRPVDARGESYLTVQHPPETVEHGVVRNHRGGIHVGDPVQHRIIVIRPLDHVHRTALGVGEGVSAGDLPQHVQNHGFLRLQVDGLACEQPQVPGVDIQIDALSHPAPPVEVVSPLGLGHG